MKKKASELVAGDWVSIVLGTIENHSTILSGVVLGARHLQTTMGPRVIMGFMGIPTPVAVEFDREVEVIDHIEVSS